MQEIAVSVNSPVAATDDRPVASDPGKLYEQNRSRVYHHVLNYVSDRETAMDLTQDIFLKAFENLHAFRWKSTFSTWLYAITRNHCIEYIKVQRRWCFAPLDNIPAENEDDDPDGNDPDTEELVALLAAGLHRLPDSDGEILRMKYIEKLQVKAICDLLQASDSAVKMRLQRARKRMLKILNDQAACASCRRRAFPTFQRIQQHKGRGQRTRSANLPPSASHPVTCAIH